LLDALCRSSDYADVAPDFLCLVGVLFGRGRHNLVI
jgi:hypothetical protein